MPANERWEQIVASVEERGFISVKDLSRLFDVSEVTIRRDLDRLHDEKRLRRIYGGAAPLQSVALPIPDPRQARLSSSWLEGLLTGRVDVLIAVSLDPRSDRVLLDRVEKRNIPLITESLGLSGAKTLFRWTIIAQP